MIYEVISNIHLVKIESKTANYTDQLHETTKHLPVGGTEEVG